MKLALALWRTLSALWTKNLSRSTLAVICLTNGVHAAENVLVLNSYHRGKHLSDETIEAIVNNLQTQRPGLTFLIEDMDTKRNMLDDLQPTLVNYFADKYRDIELAAIVTVDNNAFDFAIAHRETLFCDVPLVFCGFNGFDPSVMDGVTGVTGVTEAVEIEATVRTALALHPRTTHLAVVSDITLSSRSILGEFRRFARQLPEALEVVELVELETAELLDRLKRLPRTTIILRFSFFRAPNGDRFRVDEQVGLLTSAELPVYDFWDEGGIGNGYVGGYVVTGASQGRVVSNMLQRILEGESPEQIDVVTRSPNVPVFDKRQLLSTGADLSQLPANAVLRFDEPSFWQRYFKLLVATGIAFVVLLGFAVFFAALSFQRKRHAALLALEEQKLRATLQSMGEGVVTTNSRGEVEQINAVAQRWIGLPPEEIYGQPAQSIFKIAAGAHEETEGVSSDDCPPPTTSGVLTTGDGESLPIVRTAAPISLPHESEAGTVIVFRDMTREKQLQRELEQVRRLDALGQLAGGVAHDFNNILTAILAAAELLQDRMEDAEGDELARIILNSAEDAAGLTTQLLSFARKQPVTGQPVHLHSLVKDVAAVLTRTIDPRIEIEFRAEASLDLVYGDRALLKNCLLNLGINGAHAMPSGGKLLFQTRNMTLDPCEASGGPLGLAPGPYIELQVDDNGSGIAPDVMDRIFEPFFTTKEPGRGTGLGLAAVFGTMQQHAGSVTAESEVNRGTRFALRLPLTEQMTSAEADNESPMSGEGLVLVVDDQELPQRMARSTLEVLGYETLTAKDGLEAIEVYKQSGHRIDVVLLDMIMPRMSGRDCFDELQRMDPDVRVIAASGFSCPDELRELRGLGVTAQLKKPYSRAELSRALHTTLQVTDR